MNGLSFSKLPLLSLLLLWLLKNDNIVVVFTAIAIAADMIIAMNMAVTSVVVSVIIFVVVLMKQTDKILWLVRNMTKIRNIPG